MRLFTTYLIALFIALITQSLTAQFLIGKTEGNNNNAILDFKPNMGLALPWVNNLSPNASAGSLIFDTVDNKVKLKLESSWQDLSENSGVQSPDQIAIINSHLLRNESTSVLSCVIGNTASVARGVLVLESSDKALILPKMNQPHRRIQNPIPGTIIYDSNSNKICIYNGSEWTFWGI